MPSELTYVVPTTVDEAVAALAGDGAFALGGGTAMALLLKNRLIEPDQFVYLARVPELSGISRSSSGDLVLGATTTLRQLVDSDIVQADAPVLAIAANQVGNPRVRAVATVGGAVVHADPRQDLPPVLCALGARAKVAGPAGTREIDFGEFFQGFMETAVGEDELVLEVTVPAEQGRIAEYSRFTPGSADDYPTVGVAASLRFEPDGTVAAARIALGGVGPTVVIVDAAQELLGGRHPGASDIAAVADAATEAANPSDDQRGSASYKRAMVGVWTRRTLERCLAAAPG